MNPVRTTALGLLIGGAASCHAYDLGPLSLDGFAKQEWTRSTHAAKATEPCYGDSRGVLGFPGCGASTEDVATRSAWTSMVQLDGKLKYEFDSGTTVGASLSRRWRQWKEDIVGQPWLAKGVWVDDPTWGRLDAGTMLSRAWSRQDGFSYPIGLSTQWSETGAGFSVLKKALRYGTPMMGLGDGKLHAEVTLATNDRFHSPWNPEYDANAPKPRLTELFLQYSDDSNLIELVYDDARGAGMASWGKNPLVGAANLPVQTSPAVFGNANRQKMVVLEGQHWFTPQWELTWGLRSSYWSGSALTCDYAEKYNGCVWQGGFNISPLTLQPGNTIYPGYGARTRDWMLGLSRVDGVWTTSVGVVHLGQAKTDNPTQWGQSNSAYSAKLNLSRKVPELYPDLNVYGGLGFTHFDRLGPAPISAPSNTAFDGVDSRLNREAVSVTLGTVLVF
ncbi:hypothetical protein [Ideonella sp. B508-1]|uniref:hypothetical protein n=1 Tax=Ideonella sp. B508-1 TaxID=137716 RepID=UPI00034833B3|nr:hypothetical protein [Ideonella sp. B508-1]